MATGVAASEIGCVGYASYQRVACNKHNDSPCIACKVGEWSLLINALKHYGRALVFMLRDQLQLFYHKEELRT